MSTTAVAGRLAVKITTSPNARCRAVVVVPAKDEEHSLSTTLDALHAQYHCSGERLSHDVYEVILLLNNCSDLSEEVAQAYAREHAGFNLHVLSCELSPEVAHVGTARRALMDLAYERLALVQEPGVRAILSTDADTRVAPDWVARNLDAIEAGADVVGGVISLSSEGKAKLGDGTRAAYDLDQMLQQRVARLESLLDPDKADPWPRHLQHFGASIACTPEIYRRSGGVPPVKSLEDVAFVNSLRRIGARIRHHPDVHVTTSARLDGRAQIGLSGQLRIWQDEASVGVEQLVDSAQWLEHRFRMMGCLRRWNEAGTAPSLHDALPERWCERVRAGLSRTLPTAEFLEVIDCDGLIEDMFAARLDRPERQQEITHVLADLEQAIQRCEV